MVCLEAGADGGAVDAGEVDGGGPDAGPPNLVPNGDFELGLTQWSPPTDSSTVVVQSQRVHGGTWAARVSVAKTADPFVGVILGRTSIVGVQAGRTYCAEAWVHRGAFSQELRLTMRRYQAMAYEDVLLPTAKVLPPTDGWFVIRSAITAIAPYSDGINVRVSADNVPDAGFDLDDVRVWWAPDGGCP